MNYSQEILKLAHQNNGVITTAMVVASGFSRGSLKYLTDCGRLERISRGVYLLPEAWEDEFVSIQSRYKRGIFSLETALFLCGLTDQTPLRFYMTFPKAYNCSNPQNEGIVCNGVEKKLYQIGIVSALTPGGNHVKAYSAERTLCDVLKKTNHVDLQVVTDAFKRYTSNNKKNIPLLSEYSKIFKVERKLRSYLEVLL